MASKKQSDKILDTYLKGESPISEMYQAASDESPPAELDQKILKQAKQATRATSVASSPFSSSWMVPASWAAALLLSVGLSLLLPEEEVGLPPANPRPYLNGAGTEQTADLQNSEHEEERLREVQDIIARNKSGFQQPGKSFMPQEPVSDTAKSKRRQESGKSLSEPEKQGALNLFSEAEQDLSQEMDVGDASSAIQSAPVASEAKLPKTFAEKIKLVKPGMTKAQIKLLLGDPVSKTHELWVYNDSQSQFPGTSSDVDKPLSYSIYFEEGKVSRLVPGNKPVSEE